MSVTKKENLDELDAELVDCLWDFGFDDDSINDILYRVICGYNFDEVKLDSKYDIIDKRLVVKRKERGAFVGKSNSICNEGSRVPIMYLEEEWNLTEKQRKDLEYFKKGGSSNGQ